MLDSEHLEGSQDLAGRIRYWTEGYLSAHPETFREIQEETRNNPAAMYHFTSVTTTIRAIVADAVAHRGQRTPYAERIGSTGKFCLLELEWKETAEGDVRHDGLYFQAESELEAITGMFRIVIAQQTTEDEGFNILQAARLHKVLETINGSAMMFRGPKHTFFDWSAGGKPMVTTGKPLCFDTAVLAIASMFCTARPWEFLPSALAA